MLNSYYGRDYDAFDPDHSASASVSDLAAQALESGRYRHVMVASGMRILDVGCGGGSFLAVCKAMGADVMGVEPSEQGVASCHENGVPVFHGMLTEFLASTDSTFDLVTANHVLEHHPDPVRMLTEMGSRLRSDGKVWISVPNAGCYFSRALKGHWHSSDLPVHLHQFSIPSAEKAFEQAGLTVQGLRTESENSLSGSLCELLRRRAFVPKRLTFAMMGSSLRKDGWLGRRIDASGNGEAILMSGTRA